MTPRLPLSAFALAAGSSSAMSCRNPRLQPFSSTSIWNTPLGNAAVMHRLFSDKTQFNTSSFNDDPEFVVPFDAPDMKETPIIDQGWWGPSPAPVADLCPTPNKTNTWCHCVAFSNVTGTVRVPESWVTYGSNNNGASIMLNETHVMQLQPLYRCAPGSPLLARWKPEFMHDPVHVTSLWDEGLYGAHGGTGLSALGGSIRRGELNISAPPIQHAVKLELNARRYYYCGDHSNVSTCYRWPAIKADSYAIRKDLPNSAYNGTNPDLQTGSLLAVTAADAAALRPKLQTQVAQRLLDALATYGGYLVDDAAGNYNPLGKTNICYEAGVEDEVRELYGHSLTLGPGQPFFDDLTALFNSLSAVVNNGPGSIGGGGAPLVQPPEPLCLPPTTVATIV